MTPRLLVPGLQAPGQHIALDPDQTHYLLRVLRLRADDALELFDGIGGRWSARLRIASRHDAVVVLEAPLPPGAESPIRLVLVQCLSAADRMDFTIEKAVELGVAAIVPVASARSVVRLDDDRAARRLAHWRRIVAAAAMQCGRDRLPEIAAPTTLADWLATRDARTPGWVLAPAAPVALASAAARLGSATRDAVLLVGPESGLGDAELAAACNTGLVAAHLGPRVLRTETAGLAALAVLQARLGDLGDPADAAAPGEPAERGDPGTPPQGASV
jgi:16S rRNA (uracil1498-N3)-methyltransferase